MYINEVEAAALIGTRVQTLRNWRVRGIDGPAFYKFGRLVRYDRDEVIAWAKSCRATSTSDVAA